MENTYRIIKDNRIKAIILWVAVVDIIYCFIKKFGQNMDINLTNILFVTAVGLITYMAIFFTIESIAAKQKIAWINSIYDEFTHMQIFLDNNELAVEIMEPEIEKLKQYADLRAYSITKVGEEEGLVKILIK